MIKTILIRSGTATVTVLERVGSASKKAKFAYSFSY